MLRWLEMVLDKLARAMCFEVRVRSDNGEFETLLIVSGLGDVGAGVVVIDERPTDAKLRTPVAAEPAVVSQGRPLLVARSCA